MKRNERERDRIIQCQNMSWPALSKANHKWTKQCPRSGAYFTRLRYGDGWSFSELKMICIRHEI
jgi:hypothetical protein